MISTSRRFGLAFLSLSFIFAGENALNQLRITQVQAQEYLHNTLQSGYPAYPATIKQIGAGARATLIRGLGAFAKAYTRTESFNTWYQGFRESKKPKPPEMAKSAAENRAQLLADLRKQLSENEAAFKTATGDMKSIYKQNIDMLKDMITQQSQVDPEQDAMMDNFAKEANAQAMKEHEEKIAQWEMAYPRDPRPFIRKRLGEFLELSANVDFSATLVPDGQGKMKFANAEYQNKDARWKMCFRAGRDATNAAREVVQNWMKELQGESR